ncbi:MAG: VWA domain-containing protein, partial [Verrucomicrobia bacterium]|nr:VWA domain-containing protein [Verrucomicrobiota bacterium]
KREFATEIAGTLAFSATRSSDKVALLLFSDEVELFLPPRKGRRHILRLIREMLHCRPKHRGTNIPAALTFLNHVLHRRAIVFLLTDFLHSFGEGKAASPLPDTVRPLTDGTHEVTRSTHRDVIQEIGLTNARHDLVCVHLHDPRESALPPAGLLTIEDAETGELLELDSSRGAVRQQFAATNAERLAELDRALRHAGVDTLRLSTAEPFAFNLQRFFELRRGRRRG